VFCLAQIVSHHPGFNPRSICAVFWRTQCHCYRYLPKHYGLHLCTMLIFSSPLLYNIIAVFSNTFFPYLPLFPVLYNPSFQKFVSFYYQVQNTVLGPWLGLLNVPQFTYIIWPVIKKLNVARSFPLTVTVPQHIPWNHIIHLYIMETVYKFCLVERRLLHL